MSSRRVVKNKAFLKEPDYPVWYGAVKRELKSRKCSQRKMASDLGIDYSRLSKVICGEISVYGDSEDIAKINDYLGIRANGRKLIIDK